MSLETKHEARRRMKTLAAAWLPEERASASLWAAEALRGTPEYQKTDLILAFLSMPGEIDTTPLISWAMAEGKRLAVPRIEGADIAFIELSPDWESWNRDRFGIPVPPAERPPLGLAEASSGQALVATPGLGFTPQGLRLGRGKGYYDRFFSQARARGFSLFRVGYCFSVQVVEELPADEHDERVDALATEQGFMRIPPEPREA